MSDPLAPTLKTVRCNLADIDPAFRDPPEDPEENAAFQATLTRYMVERDVELLPTLLKPGASPTWFTVKRLPAAWLLHEIDDGMRQGQQAWRAFRAAVHRIETPAETIEAPLEAPDAHGVRLASAAWANEMGERFSPKTLFEMGMVAIDLSHLPKGRRGPFLRWLGSAPRS